METSEEGREREGAEDRADDIPPAIEELVRAGTRLALGSAGLAIASAARWQRGRETAAAKPAAGADTLASAALALGLRTQRAMLRGASAAGSTAASVTWGVVHATPLRGPVERLAEQFRSERRLSEQEVSEAIAAILEAISEAVLVRVDLDRVIDRIALERVLTRMDRRELVERIGTSAP